MQKSYREIQEGLTGYVYLGTIIFLLLALLFIFFLVISVKRRIKMKKEKTELSQKFQQELLQTQLEIQEQTFKTISQEIHDNIGQTLSLAKLNLNTIDLGNHKGLEEKIMNSKELVSKAINDLRGLSKILNTDFVLTAGLMKAIDYELKQIEKAGTFKTELIVSGIPVPFDQKKELILFRIVQEALNNIIKHSDATYITITAEFTTESQKLIVADNGKGFQSVLDNSEVDSGLGLRNMQNRAQLIGALFNIQSDSSGTRITIHLPNS